MLSSRSTGYWWRTQLVRYLTTMRNPDSDWNAAQSCFRQLAAAAASSKVHASNESPRPVHTASFRFVWLVLALSRVIADFVSGVILLAGDAATCWQIKSGVGQSVRATGWLFRRHQRGRVISRSRRPSPSFCHLFIVTAAVAFYTRSVSTPSEITPGHLACLQTGAEHRRTPRQARRGEARRGKAHMRCQRHFDSSRSSCHTTRQFIFDDVWKLIEHARRPFIISLPPSLSLSLSLSRCHVRATLHLWVVTYATIYHVISHVTWQWCAMVRLRWLIAHTTWSTMAALARRCKKLSLYPQSFNK